MSKTVARLTSLGNSLYLIEQLTRPTDPGYGNRPPTDPGYGRPGWGGRPDNSLPGFGHPDHDLPWHGHADNDLPGMGGRPDNSLPGYGRPDNGLPVPPPEGVVTPPINLPSRPQLPPGSGVVVPLPEGTNVPTPTEAVPEGAKPYVLWYGPGTQSSIVYLKPSSPGAAPK
jgi:hypothetical protein